MPKKILVISRQRSGSTAVMELLGSHPKIQNFGELLNSQEDPNIPKEEEEIYQYLNQKLENLPELLPLSGKWPSEYAAFKIHNYENLEHAFQWDNLIRYCGVEAVIVVWRKEIVEAIASADIANATGEWYSPKTNNSKIMKVEISEDELRSRIEYDIRNWSQVFESWPIEVRPIFIQYEELFAVDSAEKPEATVNTLSGRCQNIFREIGIESWEFVECYAKRQNPAPIEQKISNWASLPKELREKTLDIPALFEEIISKRFGLPKELVASMVPDREPLPPIDGFKCRVAEPYMPKEVFENVNHALQTGNISSASLWPKKLSQMLSKFYGIPVAIPCANGFLSLVLALQASNIKKGDEIIVPSLTMIAVPNAVAFLGGKPVFVDVENGEYNPSWAQIEAVITSKTKAVIVSHTYGSPAKDVEEIAEECQKRNLIFVEDISEAVGISTYTKSGESKLLGTFGDFACASMYVNKMLHAGDGGFILSKNPASHTRLQSLLNHGFTRSFHFVHFESSINAKINGLGAAVACGVLENFEIILQRRKSIAKWYRIFLEKVVESEMIELMPECGVGDSPWVFGIHCKTKSARTALRKRLAENGIETRDYFFPMHLQPAFREPKDEIQRMENSEKLGSTGFYLPTHTNLSKKTAKWIAEIICDFFAEEMPNNAVEIEAEVNNNNDQKIVNGNLHNADSKKVAEINLNNTKTNHKIGAKILEKARRCFEGSEIWDEKQKILKQLEAYFADSLSNLDPKRETLESFFAYFTATMDFESVPKNDESLEDVLAKLSPKNVVYFYKFKKNSGIIKEKCQSLIAIQIPEDGYSMDIESLPDADLAIVDLEEVSLQERFQLKIYLETKIKTLILLNANDTFMPLLADFTKTFTLQSKHASNIRILKSLPPKPDPNAIEWEELQTQWNSPLPRKLKFVGEPEWDHHHQNAYQSAIDALKAKFHDENAEILFISAIEQYICDCETTPKQPWIGIIHSIIQNDSQFYVPDLQKLCKKSKFKPWWKRCVGLFTLTTTQLEYLKANLWPEFKFPIQQLFYPSIPLSIQDNSTLLKRFNANSKIDIYFIGSFDRNFEHFFQAKFPKNLQKVLLECDWETPTSGLPEDVILAKRADSEEYERILRESFVFLSLKNGGAANTLVIECIARSIPIVAPRMASVTDYISIQYPLLYEPGEMDFGKFFTAERIEMGMEYLKNIDKSFLSQNRFLHDVETSSILSYIPPKSDERSSFDLTISICSYKRTHNLSKLLNSLLNEQTFSGSYEIILWNNNSSRRETVQKIFEATKKSNKNANARIELISSSENHVCSVRFAIASLMKSENLLICDDDIIPGPEFIQFFFTHHAAHPKDVLCVRGNKFMPHQMPSKNPHEIWTNYEAFQFIDDAEDECLIHYIHADACLIPKNALLEVTSTPAPDNDFMLVDDYWLSYILSAKFDRALRKLKLTGRDNNVISRTKDSDEIGVAMYTRKDVANARTRMYIHHMTQGWPKFDENERIEAFDNDEIKAKKRNAWALQQRIGFNINSEITEAELQNLVEMKISMVRVGIAGVGRDEGFEFAELDSNPKMAIDEMERLVKRLEANGIDVVIVLDKRIASRKNWELIAERLCAYQNVIGYDLINEPTTPQNQEQHWYEIRKNNVEMDDEDFIKVHTDLIKGIRSRDKVTPIIIETLFWANISTLSHLSINKFKELDDNLIVSIHYYLPQLLTWRTQNSGRFSFPGNIPIYDGIEHSESIHCSPEFIDSEFQFIIEWTSKTGIPVFIGEFGISRDVKGADLYLKAISESCKKYGISACMYAYRDPDWEAMDYELGIDATNYRNRNSTDTNPLYSVIRKFNVIGK